MKHLSIFSLKPNKRIRGLYALGFVALLCAVLFGLLCGSTKITVYEWMECFKNGMDSSTAGRILLHVRLPRTVAALICGAALAVSGVLIQNVLSNRLASPSVIGVNAGAGLAVTTCTALGVYGGLSTSLCAFLGAFLTVLVVSVSSRKWGASRGTVILMGVAINSLLGALTDCIVTFIPEVGVLSNDFKIGEFSSVTLQRVLPVSALVVVAVVVVFTLVNELDVITLGEEQANSLGLHVTRMRMVFLLLAAMLAGCAVSLAGLLSFVGLIVPHAVRRVAGNQTRHVLGLSTLYGGSFVCLCDTVSKSAFSPYEIPVGIIMALLGAPFFLFVLIKGKGGHRGD